MSTTYEQFREIGYYRPEKKNTAFVENVVNMDILSKNPTLHVHQNNVSHTTALMCLYKETSSAYIEFCTGAYRKSTSW